MTAIDIPLVQNTWKLVLPIADDALVMIPAPLQFPPLRPDWIAPRIPLYVVPLSAPNKRLRSQKIRLRSRSSEHLMCFRKLLRRVQMECW